MYSVGNFLKLEVQSDVPHASFDVLGGFTEVENESNPTSLLELQQVRVLPPIPEGSFFHREDQGVYEYRKGKLITTEIPGVAVVYKDFPNKKIRVFYQKQNTALEVVVRTALKWLVIKTAEENGYEFLHGAAVKFGNNHIVFPGNSGSGKSTCAYRLVSMGAEILTDDVVLLKDGHTISFDITPSVRGDFSSRVTPVEQIGHLSAEVPFNVSHLIFPRIKHTRGSSVVSLDRGEARNRLREIYCKEVRWNAYPEESYRSEILERDLQVLDFIAGYDEALGRKELKGIFSV